MADKDIPPYRCTYCLQAVPEDSTHPLFGSDLVRHQSDEPENFVADTLTILNYASAVATVNLQTKLNDNVTSQLHDLVRELIDEALRRLDRANDAFHILLLREAAAQKARSSQLG